MSVVSIPDVGRSARVRCQLKVDLSDVNWCTRNSEAEVGRRFARISDAPANAVVNVHLPANGGPASLQRSFAGWDQPPAPGVEFVIQAQNKWQGEQARADLVQAMKLSFPTTDLEGRGGLQGKPSDVPRAQRRSRSAPR